MLHFRPCLSVRFQGEVTPLSERRSFVTHNNILRSSSQICRSGRGEPILTRPARSSCVVTCVEKAQACPPGAMARAKSVCVCVFKSVPAPSLGAVLRRSLSLSPSLCKATSQSPHLISTFAHLSRMKGSRKNRWKPGWAVFERSRCSSHSGEKRWIGGGGQIEKSHLGEAWS